MALDPREIELWNLWIDRIIAITTCANPERDKGLCSGRLWTLARSSCEFVDRSHHRDNNDDVTSAMSSGIAAYANPQATKDFALGVRGHGRVPGDEALRAQCHLLLREAPSC